MTHNSIRLASAGLEFPHNRLELVKMLAVTPECPSNCSSIAECVDGVCNCPAGFFGDDCSQLLTPCESNCNEHGQCVQGVCHCDVGFTGGECQFVAQLCLANCSGHGICSHDLSSGAPMCQCEGGYEGADCSIANPGCTSNFSGHGSAVRVRVEVEG